MASQVPTGIPSGKGSFCQCKRRRRCGLDPRVRKVPWRSTATHSSVLAWRIPWTEDPGRLYSPLRDSLGFFINKRSRKCKMLCPVSLGACFDLCCLAFNQWGLSLSLFEDFLIACILHLVGVLTDFNKAFKSEKPDWPGQLFFLVSVDNQLYLFICCSFD